MTDADAPRWIYRLENFRRALMLLQEAVATLESRDLSALEKEGLIQRFEYTWELAWNVLSDYLQHTGVILTTVTPRTVIRAAFAAGIVSDGEIWMQALDARNRMSHTYSPRTFDIVVAQVREQYLAMLVALATFFDTRAPEGTLDVG